MQNTDTMQQLSHGIVNLLIIHFRHLFKFWGLNIRIVPSICVINAFALLICLALRRIHGLIKRYRGIKDKTGDFVFNLEDCPICYQPLCDPIRLQCGHLVCLDCLTMHFRATKRHRVFCSLCRQPILHYSCLDGYTPRRNNSAVKKEMLHALQGFIGQQQLWAIVKCQYSPEVYFMLLSTMILSISFHVYLAYTK